MCGIIGIIQRESKRDADTGSIDYILAGLKMLRNRGYDSCGAGLVSDDGNFLIEKFGSTTTSNAHDILTQSLHKLKVAREDAFNIGIGHNRWATHGPKTDLNAHPHVSSDGMFMLVHNGIIENADQLKQWLIDTHDYKFISQTDTEVIVALISVFHKSGGSNDTVESIRMTMDRLVGTYGIVVVNRSEPDKLYCVRCGSPLLVGHTEDLCIVTSEQSGFNNQVNSYITLENHDICVISKGTIRDMDANKITVKTNLSYTNKKVTTVKQLMTPAPYEHWTIREIHEQPTTIMNGLNFGGRIKNELEVKLGGLDSHANLLFDIEHLILLGCGSSYHSAVYCSHLYKMLCNFQTVQVYDGAEISVHDIPKHGRVAFLLVSQSGETKDLHRCIDIAREKHIVTIGVVNVVDSLIARDVDCGVYCNTGVEVGVASTKSFTSQVVCMSLIAVWFSQLQDANVCGRRDVINSLRNLSQDYADTLELVDQRVQKIAASIATYRHVFLLGKGCDASIAQEAALKIKEITYIHAEGYSSSSLKHGPFALLDENFLVVLLNCQEEHAAKNNSCYQEVLTRGAPVILVSHENVEARVVDESVHSVRQIIVKKNNYFGGLLALIPLQLLSYYVAIAKGIDPDTPKNLAKVVTVD
tara:strand:+ start:3391 stop:5313 length:1923 start_codon:yes stop_codon:yes gene_type:complete